MGNRELIEMVMLHRRSQMKETVKRSLPLLFTELENVSFHLNSISKNSIR